MCSAALITPNHLIRSLAYTYTWQGEKLNMGSQKKSSFDLIQKVHFYWYSSVLFGFFKRYVCYKCIISFKTHTHTYFLWTLIQKTTLSTKLPVRTRLLHTCSNKQPPTKSDLSLASCLPWAYSYLVTLHALAVKALQLLFNVSKITVHCLSNCDKM